MMIGMDMVILHHHARLIFQSKSLSGLFGKSADVALKVGLVAMRPSICVAWRSFRGIFFLLAFAARLARSRSAQRKGSDVAQAAVPSCHDVAIRSEIRLSAAPSCALGVFWKGWAALGLTYFV